MRTKSLLVAGIALAAAGSLVACGSDATAPSTSASNESVTSSSATGNSADVSFLQLMIPHHDQAIQMADMAIAKATSPQVKQLATQIKAEQNPEIVRMQALLSAWGAPTAMASGDPAPTAQGGGMDMGGMNSGSMDMGGVSASGMMSQSDLDALATANGTNFDQMWLKMMIAHHQGAITMAQQVLSTTTNTEVADLAQSIIDGQGKEIATMQTLQSK